MPKRDDTYRGLKLMQSHSPAALAGLMPITPMQTRHTRPMHVALDSKNRIQATWYRGCVSTYPVWRKAIRNLGYKAVKVQVVFPW